MKNATLLGSKVETMGDMIDDMVEAKNIGKGIRSYTENFNSVSSRSSRKSKKTS